MHIFTHLLDFNSWQQSKAKFGSQRTTYLCSLNSLLSDGCPTLATTFDVIIYWMYILLIQTMLSGWCQLKYYLRKYRKESNKFLISLTIVIWVCDKYIHTENRKSFTRYFSVKSGVDCMYRFLVLKYNNTKWFMITVISPVIRYVNLC